MEIALSNVKASLLALMAHTEYVKSIPDYIQDHIEDVLHIIETEISLLTQKETEKCISPSHSDLEYLED